MASFRQITLDALDLEQEYAEQMRSTGNREELERSEARIQHGIEQLAALDRGEVAHELSDEITDEAEAIAERKFIDDLPF